MKCMTKYVALDVHEATTVASVRGSVHVAFEEGTQAQWLHDLLVPLVDRVVVSDRRGEKRLGNKADQEDADDLSESLRRGALRAVYQNDSANKLRT